uniref:Uncharacterized protein n=1 Tax=Setaria italica TaxID=4555 RepID=K3ZGL0_SETIT
MIDTRLMRWQLVLVAQMLCQLTLVCLPFMWRQPTLSELTVPGRILLSWSPMKSSLSGWSLL